MKLDDSVKTGKLQMNIRVGDYVIAKYNQEFLIIQHLDGTYGALNIETKKVQILSESLAELFVVMLPDIVNIMDGSHLEVVHYQKLLQQEEVAASREP